MPELPDIVVYLDQLERRIEGAELERIRLASPFVLRTVTPRITELEHRVIRRVFRLGKRIVWAFDEELFLVIHLMIAGRFRWRTSDAKIPGKIGLAGFDFESGTLILTEASSKKRASMHVVRGEAELAANHDRGGIEPLEMTMDSFESALHRENHTLKRSLTDPRLFSGIGNAYSDEILHRARLSPLRQTKTLTGDETVRLFEAVRATLTEWVERLRSDVGSQFPEKVTAFRPEMAVHGKFGQPCPVCATKIQRIVYAENETNYCPRCQTEGRMLRDRALSRLLKDDWPRTVDELES
ncbi:MAG: formamidopyrimidine-DNA glycosylase [Deltaproteobacteria bacterium]|nr:formamidopyrimidine-DNA glycosylase [Deltaproteobacteria bacterium]